MDMLLRICLCLLSWTVVSGQHDHIRAVKLGEKVTLPCTALGSDNFANATIQWLYDKNGHQKIYTRGFEGEFKEESDMKARVSLEAGSKLVIDNVQVQDEKLYICHVTHQDNLTKESRIHLNVYKSPEEPEIKMEDKGIPETENAVQIGTCTSKNGYPSPNITWHKNNSPLINGKNGVVVTTQVTQESSGLISIMSFLSTPVQKSDVDAVFYCEVSYHLPKGTYMLDSEKKNITVHYPNTDVKLFAKGQFDTFIEGDTVELTCQGNGNPPPGFSLFRKDPEIPLAEEPSYSWKVSRGDSGGYACKAVDLDNFFELDAETEIHVHFLDSPVLSLESPVIVALGSELSISCQANASSQTEIQWIKDGETLETGPVLDLNISIYEVQGLYTCVVKLLDVPRLSDSKEFQVIVQGSPQVTVSSQPLQVQVGEMATATCTAVGNPLPQITWYINGSEADGQNLIKTSDFEVNSEVSFRVTQDLINENIICKAFNNYSSNTGSILLQERLVTTSIFITTSVSGATIVPIASDSRNGKSYGVVIVAVIVCILLLAILGAVLYFLYKKGRIPCGRSGKQDITKPGEKDQIMVEVKSESPAEESVLLPGTQEKKPPGDQEKYMHLRN